MNLIPKKTQFFLFLTGCYAAGIGTALAIESGRLYRDDNLKIEFRFPAGWEKRSCSISKPDMPCLELRPRSRRKALDPAITIEVRTANLEKTLSDHVLFEKRGNVWVKQGRVGEQAAVPIAGSDWKGFEASTTCGITFENSFHAGAGTCFTAILSNGVRAAVIETDGFESTLDPANDITKSFRFLK